MPRNKFAYLLSSQCQCLLTGSMALDKTHRRASKTHQTFNTHTHNKADRHTLGKGKRKQSRNLLRLKSTQLTNTTSSTLCYSETTSGKNRKISKKGFRGRKKLELQINVDSRTCLREKGGKERWAKTHLLLLLLLLSV